MKQSLKAHLALLTTMLLWATSFIAIRQAVPVFGAGGLAFFRYSFASLTLLVFFIFHRKNNLSKLTLIQILEMVIAGIVGIVIYNVSLNYAEIHIDPGLASFVIADIPVFALILSFLFLKEKISIKALLGIAISLFGMGIVIYSQHLDFEFDLGLGLALLSALCGAIYAVMQKPILKKISPIDFNMIVIWSSTIVALYWLPDVLKTLPTAPTHSIFQVAYLGVFPAAIGYILWSYGIKYIPVNKACTYLYAMPFCTLIIQRVVLDITPTLPVFIGCVIAVMGPMIVNFNRDK